MLFGHQNNDNHQPAQDAPAVPPAPLTPPPAPASMPGSSVNPLAVDPDTGTSLPSVTPASLDQPEPSVLDQPTPSAAVHSSAPIPAIDTVNTPSSLDAPDPLDTPPAATSHSSTGVSDDLLHLKQQAISQLSPLVGKLDQSPEEKFRTTMMLIQSTDNQSLLQEAYDAAQKITDEKARAQALLDVVNEINYFTQQKPAA